jgi:inorganic triphosphatase YgiF
MSSEIELKFRIPPARLAALRRAVATRSAQVLPLAAVYFDTPDEQLARARVALRLRREGAVWVQTLKAEGGSAMHRLEHNVVVAGARQPALDLSRHDGSAAGQALRAVLAGAPDAPLLARYATEVQRTQRLLRVGGARIELALDEGRITAGPRSLPICELEFELLAGTPQALLDVAGRWADRFGLVLDVRSKSERGHQLAGDQLASPPTKARSPRLSAAATPAQAQAAMLASALGQALANASVMADPDLAEPVAANAEYLHQLRVGLRRLRSLLRVYGPLAPPADASLAPALATLFSQLGAARDRDAMAEWLWPALHAADAPWVPDGATAQAIAAPLAGATAPAESTVTAAAAMAPGAGVDLGALLRAPATQRLWLSALAASQPPMTTAPAPASGPAPALPERQTGPKAVQRDAGRKGRDRGDRHDGHDGRDGDGLRDLLRVPLQGLLRQIRRDAGRFDRLDDAARHRLRRRIKRLRYAADAVASLWPAKKVDGTLRALARAQEPLGAYNDTVVALALMRGLAAQDGRAWFAVGWLTARREALAAPCAEALTRLSRVRGFWQRR